MRGRLYCSVGRLVGKYLRKDMGAICIDMDNSYSLLPL